MFISSLILLGLALVHAASALPCEPGDCRPDVNTPEHRAQIVSNYLNLWGGQLDLLNQTLSPNVELEIDRFPLSGNCSTAGSRTVNVHSSAEFAGLISGTRSGFAKYGFNNDHSFGQDNSVVIRWSLDGIIGENFAVLPT